MVSNYSVKLADMAGKTFCPYVGEKLAPAEAKIERIIPRATNTIEKVCNKENGKLFLCKLNEMIAKDPLNHELRIYKSIIEKHLNL